MRDGLEIPKFLRRSRDGASPPPEPVLHETTGILTDKLRWVHVPWTAGRLGSVFTGKLDHVNEVLDPPCNGWQHAFHLPPTGKAKLHTLFCPYTMTAYSVSEESYELHNAVDRSDAFRHTYAVELMRRNWEDRQRQGVPIDLDVAALVFNRLGEEVPTFVISKGEEDTSSRGGKPAADELAKPVPRGGKRGRFLEYMLAEGGGPKSVRAAMAEFGMSRNSALSYLFNLNRDHGIGYELVGDTAKVVLPDGCDDPFTAEED